MEQVLVNVIKNAIEACEAGQQVAVDLSSQQLSIRDNGTPHFAAGSRPAFQSFFQ